MIYAEIIVHHVYGEQNHDEMIGNDRYLHQIHFGIVSDNESEHKHKAGGYYSHEIFFKHDVQFSPEYFAENKKNNCRSQHGQK